MTPPSLTKAISNTFVKDTTLPTDIDGYLKVSRTHMAAAEAPYDWW